MLTLKIIIVVLCIICMILWLTLNSLIKHPDAYLIWEDGTDTDGDSKVYTKMVIEQDIEDLIYKGFFTVRVKHITKE